jgi:hypothetical protein
VTNHNQAKSIGQKLIRFALVIVLLLFMLTPFLIYSRLASKDAGYSQTIAKYECAEDNCAADFDGDGRAGNLLIDRTSSPPSGRYLARQAWLVVNDSHRELLRLPFSYADSTLRTHVAIRNEMAGARLLIFDHTIEGKPIRQVFAWNGEQMVQVQSSAADQEILAALGARDDTGSWNDWALYRFLGVPILAGYYVSLAGILGSLIIVRHRRKIQNLKSKRA